MSTETPIELTKDEARYLLDGIVTMHSESWSPTNFSHGVDDALPRYPVLINRLASIAELSPEELRELNSPEFDRLRER